MDEISTLVLDGEHIMQITREPDLYRHVPFLMPMREAALQVHARFSTAKKCPACMAPARARAAKAIGSAFGSLVLGESKKSPNDLIKLRHFITALLKRDYTEIVIGYSVGKVSHRLVF